LATRRTTHMWMKAGGERPHGTEIGLTSTHDHAGNPWLTYGEGDFGWKETGFHGCATSTSMFFLCEAPRQEPSCSAIVYQEGMTKRYHLGEAASVPRPAQRQDWKRVSPWGGRGAFWHPSGGRGVPYWETSEPDFDIQFTLALHVVPGI